jgi:hypothetical protein
MKIKYRDQKFTATTLAVIKQANVIVDEYAAQGYDLTLRQLYYQFVARGYMANKIQNYNRLGSIVNDARLAGLIDWQRIEDRTRNVKEQAHWSDPAELVDACASQFRVDLWTTQPHRVEVWIEKDALMGVIENVCTEFDVPYFACRGYVSQSEMWRGAMRAVKRATTARPGTGPGGRAGQRTIVLHFGDHDPSGIDMTRDIQERCNLFCAHHGARGAFEIRRLALNMDQVEQYNPPPNPAKATDARFAGYQAIHGDESWELDALEPSVIDRLIRDEIESLIVDGAWQQRRMETTQGRAQLQEVSDKWSNIVLALETGDL